jgi:hypothetical protein
VRTHQGSPWKHLMPAGLCGLFVVGGIYAIATFDPPSPGKAALVVVGFALLMLFFTFLAVREAAARLELRERGLVYTRGGIPKAVRYADIARAVERSFNHKPAQLILELRAGGSLEIQAHLVDYEAAAQAIARAI